MKINRRQTLFGLGAVSLPLRVAAAETNFLLRPTPVELAVGERTVELLGYNGSVPGVQIRLRQGDTLSASLENTLEEGTMIHWHGIRVPNPMDGVNVLTQDAVIPGGRFHYRFPVPDAGTYWYHSHYLELDQVGRGMFGPLIIEEQNPPDVDQDITIQLFDMLTDSDGNFDRAFHSAHYATAGRLGNIKMAFSSSSQTRVGERLRLRFINPSVDRVFQIALQGLAGMVVALDGMPLAYPVQLKNLVLSPGQRVDVIGDVKESVQIFEQSESRPVLLNLIDASGFRSRRKTGIEALPPNRLPSPGDINQEVDLVMQGGAGGKPHGGFGRWAFNDVSGLPRRPLLSVKRGDTVRIRLVNDTAFQHGVHLHGHHFWETDESQNPTVLRDTTLVGAWTTREILCVLDNPGPWLIHCHMLSHQADGMATWLRVS